MRVEAIAVCETAYVHSQKSALFLNKKIIIIEKNDNGIIWKIYAGKYSSYKWIWIEQHRPLIMSAA